MYTQQLSNKTFFNSSKKKDTLKQNTKQLMTKTYVLMYITEKGFAFPCI